MDRKYDIKDGNCELGKRYTYLTIWDMMDDRDDHNDDTQWHVHCRYSIVGGGVGGGWNGKCIAVRFPSQYPLVLLVNVDPTEERSVEK